MMLSKSRRSGLAWMPLLALLPALSTACGVEKAGVGEACAVGSDCDSERCLRGICQPARSATCQDDALEPNDSLEQARPLTLDRDYEGLVLCSGDEDWFALELAQAGGLRLEVLAEGHEPPASVTLRSAAGEPSSPSDTQEETGRLLQTYAGLAAGSYRLQVAMGQGDPGRYSLRLAQPLDCADPEGDDLDGAPPLLAEAATVERSGSLCPPQDQDWWAVDLGPRDALHLDLTPQTAATLTLELWGKDAAGEALLLATGTATEAGLGLDYVAGLEPGAPPYGLRVAPARQVEAELAYALTGRILRNDAGEPGNDLRDEVAAGPALAVPTDGSAAPLGGVLVPGDTDWYRIEVPAAHTLRVRATAALEEGAALRVALLPLDSEAPLAGSEQTAVDGTLDLTLDPELFTGQPLLLAVDAAALLDGGQPWGEYELQLSASAGPPPACVDDPREADEPFDVALTAGLSGGAVLDDGWLCPGDTDHLQVSDLAAGERVELRLSARDEAPLGGLSLTVEQGGAALEAEVGEDASGPWQRFVAPAAGTLDIEVASSDALGEAGRGYRLSLLRSGACADEEDSEAGGNDDLETAVELALPATAPGFACALDADVYYARVAPGTLLRAVLRRGDATGELRLRRLDPAGLADQEASGDPDELELEFLAQTDPDAPEAEVLVFFAVDLAAGESLAYQLELSGTAPPSLEGLQLRIFDVHCAECHTAGHESGLELDAAEASFAGLVGVQSSAAAERLRVRAYDPATSYLLEKVDQAAPTAGAQMPQGRAPLDVTLRAELRAWVAAGARRDQP